MSASVNLERLRKEAKSLLRLCRAGESSALDRIHKQLPGISSRTQIKLADVQHALARELGFASWARLKHQDDPVARFLHAIRGGHLQIAVQELESAHEISVESLPAASAIGDVEAVRYHLEHDPGLANDAEDGWTALDYACSSCLHRLGVRYAMDIVECARLLLEHGARLSPISPPYIRPSGNRGIMMLLMQRGLMPNPAGAAMNQFFAPDTSAPLSPMDEAQRNLRMDPSFQEELQERMANERAMSGAFQQRLEKIKAGLGPVENRTSLLAGKSTRELFDVASQLDHRDGSSWGGAFGRHYFELAFRRGLDANLPVNEHGEVMLHRITRMPEDMAYPLAALFLKNGADPNIAAKDGRTPLALAIRMGATRIAELLLAHGANSHEVTLQDRLLGACRTADAETAKSVLRSNPQILTSVAKEAKDILMLAVKNGNEEATRLMVELGFDVVSHGETGNTPLHLAAWFGYPRIVEVLVRAGAPVNDRDAVHRTAPLEWAAHGSRNCRDADADYCAVVKTLMDAGASWNMAQNNWENRPESVAADAVAKQIRS